MKYIQTLLIACLLFTEDSTIAFEHEDGTIYFGSFYFVHNTVPDRPADLNHV